MPRGYKFNSPDPTPFPGIKRGQPSGCHPDQPAHAKGLCNTCWSRYYRRRYLEKMKAYARDRRAKNRDQYLCREYDITLEELTSLRASQDNKCKICGAPPPSEGHKRFLCVDHDHTTGKVRGLLCDKCNMGLGCFTDSVEKLLAAAQYLREHGSSPPSEKFIEESFTPTEP